MRKHHVLPTDPVESAVVAGLRYVTGAGRGIIRKRAGTGFSFLDPDGKPIRDRNELGRIKGLVIPPAWTNVWICPLPHGHLQAVGYDARGRKQYRYHPVYRQVRNQTKFSRMVDFGKALPGIRRKVREDLTLEGLAREKVLATVVRLLETTFIRIGNVEYARENNSFGLTTMRSKHVEVDGGTMRFHFRGKSGVEHEVELHDRRLARVVKQCHDLPGYELFQYINEDGQRHAISSEDVNMYLRQISGEEFTAKDFRTWAGTVQTALALREAGGFDSEAEAKRNIVTAIKSTALKLGNKPATCRNYYVHPAILDAYTDGSLLDSMARGGNEDAEPAEGELNHEERCVMAIIRKRQQTAEALDFLSSASEKTVLEGSTA